MSVGYRMSDPVGSTTGLLLMVLLLAGMVAGCSATQAGRRRPVRRNTRAMSKSAAAFTSSRGRRSASASGRMIWPARRRASATVL